MRLHRPAPTLVLLGALSLGSFSSAAGAQGLPDAGAAVGPLMHGALVYHGNYCGPGSKGLHPAPVDALDAACERHDACVKDFDVPSCGCNARLAEEAAAVAADPAAPSDEREAADFTAQGAKALPCR